MRKVQVIRHGKINAHGCARAPEVFLGVRLKEKGKWKLGLKATAGTPTISWRLRVRHFRKKG